MQCCLNLEIGLMWSGEGVIVMAPLGSEFSRGEVWGAPRRWRNVSNVRTHPKRKRSPLQTHPFAWGCCLLEGAAGEEVLLGPAQCWNCLVDYVQGSLKDTDVQNQRIFILNSYSQLNMQTPNLCVYVNTNDDSRKSVRCLGG